MKGLVCFHALAVLVALGCEPAPSPLPDEPEPRSVPDADPILFIQDMPEELPPPPDSPPGEMPDFPHPKELFSGCREGMVRVTGNYCLEALHTCIELHSDSLTRRGDKTVSERCLRYLPARCAAERHKKMDFCIDRYEYPNQIGQLPRVLTSWREAKRLCAAEGKRLCSVEEFNFACEGPDMNPYATGYERDAVSCNIDQPYYQPDHARQMLPYQRCLQDEWCRGELQRLDQRHAIGRQIECVTWAGVVDMNGNVNEWVEIAGAAPPNRSGLKGGWWGPVRNRCRPTVTFH
jgi:hypothetical protein